MLCLFCVYFVFILDKLLDLRYSSTEEEDDEPENVAEVDQIQVFLIYFFFIWI